MFFFFILIFLSLCSCEYQPPNTHKEAPLHLRAPSYNWARVNSRDDGDPTARFPLYYAKVPTDWIRIDATSEESLADTKKPLCEFLIEEGEAEIKITIHNFPSNTIEERIPPLAQIDRWKGQFESLERTQTYVHPAIHNGFIGLFLECEGILQKKPSMLLGWAMQLAPEYYTILSFDNSLYSRQERADYTIKAVGNPQMMKKHRSTIMFFAHSFQLIDELPEPQP